MGPMVPEGPLVKTGAGARPVKTRGLGPEGLGQDLRAGANPE